MIMRTELSHDELFFLSFLMYDTRGRGEVQYVQVGAGSFRVFLKKCLWFKVIQQVQINLKEHSHEYFNM